MSTQPGRAIRLFDARTGAKVGRLPLDPQGFFTQVNATPSFLFGNKLFQNAISYDEFKRHVDTALSAARPPAKTK